MKTVFEKAGRREKIDNIGLFQWQVKENIRIIQYKNVYTHEHRQKISESVNIALPTESDWKTFKIRYRYTYGSI
jgi:hypothetical protein